ncbi:MAG: hypothetical protein K2J33_06795 [Alistipes sp.]|nr:hypothetical protein [Alistipes sp.]
MKKLLFFAVAGFAMAACSDYDDSGLRGKIDDLDGKLSELEQQIEALQRKADKINDDIAAVQAIANGLSITSVTPTANGGYTVVFSDGQTYTISDGAKGDKGADGEKGDDAQNPVFRIDAEGYWQISYDGTTWSYPNGQKISALGTPGASGPAGSAGAQGSTPRLGVDAEGYWTVSYDGGAPERLTDAYGAPVKAVVDDPSVVYDSLFSSVEISEDGATLDIVLVGSTQTVSLPIGGKPLAWLLFDGAAVEGVQTFACGESRAYTVAAADADYMKVVGCPDGWNAKLADNTLTVTAPAAVTRATADSATDVSLMVVMKSGLTCIVRMQVEVDASSPVEPSALTAPVLKAGASTASSVTVEWTLDARAAGYVYKVGADGAEQSLAKVAAVTVGNLAADTEYAVYVKAKGDGAAWLDSEWASIAVKTLAAGSPVEPTVQTLTLDAQAMSEAGLGLPTGKAGMTAGNVNTWTWDGIGFESYLALATSANAAAEKVPVLYFYKAATAGTTTLRNTDPLGEITKITVTLIDNGSKKGSIFTMTADAGGAESTVLSSNDNTKAVEHVYTFPAGNNGLFSFANASAEDGKVVSIVIEYKK